VFEALRVRATVGVATCGYCRAEIETAAIWAGPRCRTAHHRPCAFENRRCTVFGCGALVVDEAWEGWQFVTGAPGPRRLSAWQRRAIVCTLLGLAFMLGVGAYCVTHTTRWSIVDFGE
jgi:hypothetical protein